MIILVWTAAWAAEPHPVSFAVVEGGAVSGSLLPGEGVEARGDLAWRGAHVGLQAMWTAGQPVDPPLFNELDGGPATAYGYEVSGPDPWRGELRPLATAGYYVADQHVQVGAGLAAGPVFGFSRDLLVLPPDIHAALYWTATVRLRIHHQLEVYVGELAQLNRAQFDGSVGIGWLR